MLSFWRSADVLIIFPVQFFDITKKVEFPFSVQENNDPLILFDSSADLFAALTSLHYRFTVR
jgi:hypothetical protein